MDDVLSFALRAPRRSLYSIHCVAALVSVQDRCCSTSDFRPKYSRCSGAGGHDGQIVGVYFIRQSFASHDGANVSEKLSFASQDGANVVEK